MWYTGDMSNNTYISITELGRRTGLPLAWLKAEAKAQRIPNLQVGRRRLFSLDAVRQSLAERGKEGRR